MLSGFDERSCLDQSQRLRKYLLKRQKTGEHGFLHDLSFTLNERRSRFMWKTAVVGDSVTSLIDALSSSTKPKSSIRTPTLGFVFTGQGAQWAGMGKELLDAYPVFQESIAKIDVYLRHIGAPFTARGM
jgi:acyl transferase domain-containing protein